MTDDDTPEARGRRLRALRDRHGLTQPEMGRVLRLRGGPRDRARSVSRMETRGCTSAYLALAQLAMDGAADDPDD